MRRPAILLVIMLAAVSLAAADHPFGNIPWPNLLPPQPGVAANPDPAQPCGATPAPACVDGVIADMVEAWQPLDATCDHRAVFALVYLRTTEAFREYLSDVRGESFFADEAAIIQLDRVFADLYFAAFSGAAVPPAWRMAFDAARSGRTDGVQDLFLGMNAHIQRDLPVALAAVGLVQGDGASRKADHDRVNDILASVVDEFQDEVARRYDPHVSALDASPSPADEELALEILKSWREGAWRNAERLTLARTDAERAVVMEQIEAYSTLWANVIAAADFSWYESQRDAYCRTAAA